MPIYSVLRKNHNGGQYACASPHFVLFQVGQESGRLEKDYWWSWLSLFSWRQHVPWMVTKFKKTDLDLDNKRKNAPTDHMTFEMITFKLEHTTFVKYQKVSDVLSEIARTKIKPPAFHFSDFFTQILLEIKWRMIIIFWIIEISGGDRQICNINSKIWSLCKSYCSVFCRIW